MKLRIRADLILDSKDTITKNQILDFLEGIKPKLKGINTTVTSNGEPEVSRIDVEECRHDEGKPCTRLSLWQKE